MRLRLPWALAVIALAAGCASLGDRPSGPREVTPFSTAQPGEALPIAWQPWSLFRAPTRYELARDGGTTVVKATARNSASGLIHRLDIDPNAEPLLSWRWKLDYFPSTSEESPDDSPVRVVVSFDGDIEQLPFGDRLFYTNFRLFTGQQLPYAALMYIWGTRSALETTTPTKQTGRVRMIVVENGRGGLGQWRQMTRNVREDFRRAFGEEPGRIVSIGFMTETDETARDVEAWYGDFSFHRSVRDAAP